MDIKIDNKGDIAKQIFDLCPDMIGIVIGDRIVDINNAGIRLLHATHRQAVIGRSFWDFLHPDYHAKVRERLEQNRQIGEQTVPMEQVYVRDDGSTVHVEVKSARFPSESSLLPQYLFLSRDITNELENRDRLYQMAYRDFLTGLWNRRKLLTFLEESFEQKTPPVAVMFLDIDQFKVVNDTFGHDTGDALLLEVAHRLTRFESEQVFISRTGGDEFCLVVLATTEQAQIPGLAQNLIQMFENSFVLSSHTVQCSTSLGVALRGEFSNSPLQLLKNADIALYQAKAQGRNQFVVYKESQS